MNSKLVRKVALADAKKIKDALGMDGDLYKRLKVFVHLFYLAAADKMEREAGVKLDDDTVELLKSSSFIEALAVNQKELIVMLEIYESGDVISRKALDSLLESLEWQGLKVKSLFYSQSAEFFFNYSQLNACVRYVIFNCGARPTLGCSLVMGNSTPSESKASKPSLKGIKG